METLLKDIEGVTWYQDDIALGGKNRKDHLERLSTVLQRLQDIGLRTQPTKLRLLQSEIQFLGYTINLEGISPIEGKLEAIHRLPQPSNTKQLRSFLGSVNYYSRFIPSLQSKCAPLHRLLQKDSRWNWTENDTKIFQDIKHELTSDCLVVHYQDDLPLVLTVDACEYGVGAVLQHRYNDGSLKLIAASSRTLDNSEKNYASIDREALAIMFGVAKFERYLLGREFILQMDHRPLTRIFGNKEGLPKVASSRLTRWALQLSNFNYKIEYIAGSENNLADSLSRLPLKQNGKSEYKRCCQRYPRYML